MALYSGAFKTRALHTIILSVGAVLGGAAFASDAFAAISFVSAGGGATLVNTIDDSGTSVFVIGGVADGESVDLAFSTDSDCPGVAMTGGAEFASNWRCVDGEISASVTYRGGMSFGPATDENANTFYVTFSNPPTPAGLDAPPAELSGIQIAVFGDVSSWSLTGEVTSAGAAFGAELSGTQGGAVHFRMGLPAAAADFLGGVLGVYVGGKSDPFATVTTNDDHSVAITVDIASLTSAGVSAAKVGTLTSSVTKKITAGPRKLGVGFNKSSVKTGKSVGVALCAGTDFTSGAKLPITFTVGGKNAGVKETLTLNAQGCGSGTVKFKSNARGKVVTANVKYKGKKAKATVKVTT